MRINNKTLPKIRIFFGLPLGQQQADWLKKQLLEQHPHIDEEFRWLKFGNYHITMRFIGEVARELVPELINAFEPVVKQFSSFMVQVDKIHHFPAYNSRLIAAYVKPHETLERIFQSLEHVITGLNLPSEERSLIPHITLCRQKKTSHYRIRPIIFESQTLQIKEIILYESQFAEGGNVYLPLHHFNLT